MTLLVLSTKSLRRSGCNFVNVESLETGRIVGKPRGQQLKVLYPKFNKQEDSWECGYYVMSWIRTIIRVAIKDE
ncbi:hypothetical protein DEO72_LG10g2504 [Vigna unguiculata]|uniref:Ubiquitin-like protease family profile domain-containing protein n=1 Tax=Vigna unguiculata TaxID=3917 RepID=A0A4D6NEG8_VIGUN|nr:hypothetical protein DEO72_LG10g2504 [Vigna unguiculata]